MKHARLIGALGAPLLAAGALAEPSGPPSSSVFDDFNGGFGVPWDTFTYSSDPLYQGFPDHVFQDLLGAGVIRLETDLGAGQYTGMNVASYCFSSDIDYVEARFNTLNLNNGGIFVLRIVSPSGHSLAAGVYGLSGGTNRVFRCWSSIVTLPLDIPFAFQDNTWYRIRISNELADDNDVFMTVFADDGTPLHGCEVNVPMSEMEATGFGLYLQIQQEMDSAATTLPVNCAVDYVRVVADPCVADFSPPEFVLDFSDLIAFLEAFNAMDPPVTALRQP